MAYVVNALATLSTFPFKDYSGALVTGKVTGDWTKRVFKDGVVSAVAATVTEVTSLSGYYSTSLTPTATGIWTVIVEYTADPTFAWGSDPIEVITAAADPAALATAVAAVQTTVDGIDTLVDVAVSTRATVAALSSLGLLISSPGAQVASAGSLSIRRGDTTTWTITLDIDLTGATIWFAAKPAIMASPTADLDDATAIIDAYWIHGGASAVTDINGASVGTITVTDVAAGTVVIVLTSAFTTTLSAMSISWEVQIKTSSGAIVTWTNGTLTISNDLIRRVTTP